MNSFIETLNWLGDGFTNFAWPMFWQSCLLILVLFAFEYLFQRKVRASVRYILWLVVLLKLCMPPTIALPTSPVWWLHKTPPPTVTKAVPHYTVTYGNEPFPEIPNNLPPPFTQPKPKLIISAWLLIISALVSLALLGWLLVRWWQITRLVNRTKTSQHLMSIADEAQRLIGLKFGVPVKLTANSMSPAVCGLFRPAILIPQSLAENFSDEQLRGVLLHELIHLRRRDVWANFTQALLQIFYWWHPLVWLANARIRRVREEAVDDAVMLALCDDAESYAPTLLEVAKLAFNRPLASLGLVGILESRHALRQRIERLVDFRPPRQAGLTLVSLLGILAFTAVAVPMGDGPSLKQILPQIHIKARFIEMPKGTLSGLENIISVTNQVDQSNRFAGLVGILTDKNFKTVWRNLKASPDVQTLAEPEVVTTSGRQTQMRATVIQTIVTNFTFQETSTNAAIIAQTGTIEPGPVVDLVPDVLRDGFTIDLQTTVSLTVFLGYDKPTNSTVAYNSKGEKIDLPQVLPRFREQQASTHLQLRDGETVVLGKLESHHTVGGVIIGAKPDVIEKNLLVFITVTIVDAAGNRIHADKDAPAYYDDMNPNGQRGFQTQ